MLLEVTRNWLWLQRSQWLRKERLAEIQARKLREIVNHAFDKVPFYQRLYKATAGIDGAKDTRSITKLPTITRQDLVQTSLEERTASDAALSSCIYKTSSGSSGMPVTVLKDPSTRYYAAAHWLRKFLVYGLGPGDRACVSIPGQAGSSLFSNSKGLWGWVLRRKVRELSLATDLKNNLKMISSWKPDLLAAPPSYFRTFIEFAEELGQFPTVKIALTMGEMLDSSTRKLIRDKLQAEVFETYGLAETGGVAWECPTHSGLHINAESLVVEFLKDGEPVASGESGEICVTHLSMRATPIIRYRVGDLATPLDVDCPCGRGLPLMKDIQGRLSDYIVTEDGRHVSPYTVMSILEGISGTSQYKVTQRKDHSIELLLKTTESKTESILQQLQLCCKQLFGDTPVTIAIVERIERPTGRKFKVVESELERQVP